MGAQAEAALLAGGPVGLVPARPPDGPELDAGPLPRGYDLTRVARSHSHIGYPPAGFHPATGTLHRVLHAGRAGPVAVTARQAPGRLAVRLPLRATGDAALAASAAAQVRRVLAADDDLTGLAAAAEASADLLPLVAREVRRGGGRLLRAPTVWEDLVAVVLSTGWSWAAARGALSRLVAALGEAGPDGEQAFPAPVAVASADPVRLAAAVRAGHRTAGLLALARDVASGRVDPESWLAAGARGGDPARTWGSEDEQRADDTEVRRALLGLRGVGPWSADVLLGLLGRPRGLALDPWALRKLARLLDAPGLTPAEATRRYAPLGRWAGTGAWLELTADWHDGARNPGATL